jgi:hypothetical protein
MYKLGKFKVAALWGMALKELLSYGGNSTVIGHLRKFQSLLCNKTVDFIEIQITIHFWNSHLFLYSQRTSQNLNECHIKFL